MKDYAAMNTEQRTAYDEGLLDALDVLWRLRDSYNRASTAWAFIDSAHDAVSELRNQQRGAAYAKDER
jgi:hypothetical protein